MWVILTEAQPRRYAEVQLVNGSKDFQQSIAGKNKE